MAGPVVDPGCDGLEPASGACVYAVAAGLYAGIHVERHPGRYGGARGRGVVRDVEYPLLSGHLAAGPLPVGLAISTGNAGNRRAGGSPDLLERAGGVCRAAIFFVAFYRLRCGRHLAADGGVSISTEGGPSWLKSLTWSRNSACSLTAGTRASWAK